MGDPTGLDILGRLLPSLALIVGALLLVRRWAQRGHSGSQERLRVIGRTALTRTSSLAVVQVGERRFLVGAAEQNVTLLSELDPDDEPVVAEHTGNSAPGILQAATDRRAANHPDRPRIGLVDRLRMMTVRSHLEGPIRVSRD